MYAVFGVRIQVFMGMHEVFGCEWSVMLTLLFACVRRCLCKDEFFGDACGFVV